MSPARGEAPQASGRLRPAKHEAIMTGGREVFARDGFARASIDAIATASGVSTRTIYKHFADKPALFAAVIVDSAGRVAEAEIALIDHHLATAESLAEVESALRAFAIDWLDDTGDWLATIPHSAAHRALIGQVHAEAGHLGREVIQTWWQAGAGRVRAELARVLARWGENGLLRIADAERAAVHFSCLVSAQPGPPASVIRTPERTAWIADGVAVFIRGHQP
ncbi:TetR/AcrR family transcriptional regulator [Actinoalloteichus hymeniacidonis]|uniref:Transcriptional regulator, TetR family n=1 Tax=Actinoalloteichus hymeniacidonis TaxID=340345 RepID=A0AAC9HMY6_9PSEU|nr:TetR/AcrR family transcriptional regulator [Actinoalloteichus hymeniacidonis]AOS62243.1 transcriptional regulator, TetR family [Actinoalloteichus hymeniacidonis]MBB5909731.1 AcrR family transcriptional regulator [Actinoalloteichus hymeniacidonis]